MKPTMVVTGPIRRFWAFVDRVRFALLLVMLLGLFVAQPFAHMLEVGGELIVIGYAFVLIVGFHLTAPRTTIGVIGIIGTLVWLAVTLAFDWDIGVAANVELAIVINSILLAGLNGWCTTYALFNQQETDRDALFGAMFGYFLIAMMWSQIYTAIELWSPGAFHKPEGSDTRSEMLYFSLVTLTTLGYGDIHPIAPLARILAGVQSAFGTLYIAVLIGRIVGAFRAR